MAGGTSQNVGLKAMKKPATTNLPKSTSTGVKTTGHLKQISSYIKKENTAETFLKDIRKMFVPCYKKLSVSSIGVVVITNIVVSI